MGTEQEAAGNWQRKPEDETAVLNLAGDRLLSEDTIRGTIEEDAALAETELPQPDIGELTPQIRKSKEKFEISPWRSNWPGPLSNWWANQSCVKGVRTLLRRSKRKATYVILATQ